MKQFKIRCSQIGKIITQPKTKKDKEAGILSQTAKSYCQVWLKEQLYGRKHEFSSKQTEKGLIVEDDSIDFISDYLNFGLLFKNESSNEDEYMTGTHDIELPELIIDVKNSWDCFTFPLFNYVVPSSDNYWQAQGYMNLLNKKKFKVIYVLSDTPANIIQREAYFYAKNNGYGELDKELYDLFEKKMTYKGIPDHLKIKVFDIERNQDDIDFIKNQVVKCRNYIAELLSYVEKKKLKLT